MRAVVRMRANGIHEAAETSSPAMPPMQLDRESSLLCEVCEWSALDQQARSCFVLRVSGAGGTALMSTTTAFLLACKL